MVVATTHFDALKTYASTTEGVASAGFGFNPHTFAPTYRLNYGSPGSSLALEIASRLGLPQSIIEQARGVRGEREAQLAEHLAKIDRELQDLEHQKRLVAREQQTVRETQARLHAREQELKDREETFRRRLDQRIDERMREARREIDAVVEGLKARASTIASNAERKAARLVPTGEIGSARSDARSALDAVGTKLRDAVSGPSSAPPAPPAERSRPAAVGDRVAVGVLGLEGTVQSIQDGHADVDVRGKRMRAKIGELRVLAAAVSGAPKPQVRVNVDMAPRTASLSELNVIGSTSDEAVTKVERFIDDAMMSDVKSVRIIHGYGTGQLRRSIAEFLKGHPYVAHFGPAPDNQGGGGVTVAELKE
jgi:DNA mismatch repair protein MutS2